jgi:CRISPR-associated endoribonuclease Cas6
MKLKIYIQSNNKIKVPYGFSEYLQALIYNFLDRISAEWLHENGFSYEKRKFKLFVYSSFLEKPLKINKEKKEFVFPGRVCFIISSPLDWLIKQVAQNIVISEEISIGKNSGFVSGVEIIPEEKIDKSRIRINALSPIEVHSTHTDNEGVKKTRYYAPTETEFSKMVNENQHKKWKALLNEDCPYNLSIKPVKSDLCKKQVRKFKNTIIEGYTGHYYIEGDSDFLNFAVSTGLGSRNSGGFGMVEIV